MTLIIKGGHSQQTAAHLFGMSNDDIEGLGVKKIAIKNFYV